MTDGADPASGPPGPASSSRSIDLRDAVVLALLVGGLSVVLVKLARAQFCFFDMSAFMDVGYRIASGQRIYVDFTFNAGPIHPYVHALSYRLLGFGQVALLTHLVVATAVAMVVMYIVAARRGTRIEAATFAVLTGLSTYGVVAHPWYDVTASLWLLLAFAAWELARPLDGRLPDFVPVSTGVLVALAAGSKLNVGGIAAVAFLLPLLVAPGRRRSIVLYLCSFAAASAMLLVTLPSPAAFVEQMRAYLPAKRLLQLPALFATAQCTPHVYLLMFGLLLAPSARSTDLPDRAVHLALLAALTTTSIVTGWTSSLSPLVNLSLLAPELFLIMTLVQAGLERSSGAVGGPRPGATSMLAALLVMPFAGLCVWHMARGTAWAPLPSVCTYPMRSPGLTGWRAQPEVGPWVDRAVDEIRARVPASQSLFVFPDATVIYGLAGRPSYPGAPFIFHQNDFPPPGEAARRFAERFRAAPPEWILCHDQSERRLHFCRPRPLLRWLALNEFVEHEYRQVWAEGPMRLLRRESRFDKRARAR